MGNIKKQPPQYSDVIVENILSIDAQVVVTDNELTIGTPLVTVDGGKSFTKAIDSEDVEVNGILCDILDKSDTATVLLVGKVVEKHIDGITDRMKLSAFENKIILV